MEALLGVLGVAGVVDFGCGGARAAGFGVRPGRDVFTCAFGAARGFGGRRKGGLGGIGE